MVKTINELSEEICRREGGKINLSIAQVKEVVSIISDIHFEQVKTGGSHVGTILLMNGERRSKNAKPSN